MKQKHGWIICIVALCVVGFIWWGIQDGKNKEALQNVEVPTDTVVYYYGETCPACLQVNDFLEKENIASQVDFEKKEVWKNAQNSAEMLMHSKMCGLDKGDLGVPFLFARGECLIGVTDVVGFFESEIVN